MLPGCCGEMNRDKRRGRVVARFFGVGCRGRVAISVFGAESRSTSGSIMLGADHVGGVIGRGHSNDPGRRS